MKTQEQRAQEILALLGELFQDGSIGLYPVRNDNGADSFRCPSCSASKDTMGFAFGQMPINDVEHDQRCDLNLLHTMYQEYAAAQEPEEDEADDQPEDQG